MTRLVYMVILDFIESNQEQFAEFCGDESIAWANHNEFKAWLEARDKSDAKILYELKAENERLNKEAHWLALHLSNAMMVPAVLDSLQAKSAPSGHIPTPEMIREQVRRELSEREAARKAVEKEGPHA